MRSSDGRYITNILGFVISALFVMFDSASFSCTDGVDCLCDNLANTQDPLYRADLVRCDDFEHPNLRQYGSTPQEWHNLYFVGSDGCNEDTGGGVKTAMGKSGSACIDIVDETTPTFSDGGCGVTGETDCVFDGTYSLGHILRPGSTGGITGDSGFNNGWTGGVQSTFGMTYVM